MEDGSENGESRGTGARVASVLEAQPGPPTAPDGKEDIRGAFKGAARAATEQPKPAVKLKRRTRRGGGARSLNAGTIAADYLKLCRDPARDIRRWIEEDRRNKKGSGRSLISKTKGGSDVYSKSRQADAVARAVRIRQKPLHEVRSGMDTAGERRPLAGRLSAGSRSSVRGDGKLRSLRGEGGTAGLDRSQAVAASSALMGEVASAFKAERAGLVSFYAARIEAVRRGATPAAIAAAIRALVQERSVALREMANRRHAAERKQSGEKPLRPAATSEKSSSTRGFG
jgi:hypothetical protein